MWYLLAASCTGTGPGAPPPPTGGGPPDTVAECAPTDHPLLFVCSATLAEPGPAVLTVSGPGVARTFTEESPLGEHEIRAWGLPPDTELTYTLAGVSGTFTTGPLPEDLATATLEVTGEAFGFDAVLQPLACDETWFVLVDPAGRIVWYAPSPGFFSWHDGYNWSAADRTLLTVGDGAFVELDLAGEVVGRLVHGIDYESPLHHDVARWNGHTYLLFQELFGSVLTDGIYVFDGDVLRGRFFLGEAFSVPSEPFDWSHANGIHPNDDGDVALSLAALDSVALVDGDPDRPTFLDVKWVATGSTDGFSKPDYAAPAGDREGYENQHGASFDGTSLFLFDNASQSTSRALQLSLDAAAETVSVEQEWPLSVACPVQGGAEPVPGGVLVTCAPTADVTLFPATGTAPAWTLTSRCSASTDVMTRAIPVWID